jgi:hypothetical protein
MEWYQVMPATFLSRNANVAHDTANPAASHEDPRAFAPDAVQLVKEMLIVLKMAHLAIVP